MGLFSTSTSFPSIVQNIVSLINLMVGVLSAFAIVIFFWGLVRFIRESSDSHSHNDAKEQITWSLIALFVLFSIWGILALMSVAFFGGTNTYGGTGTTTDPSNSYYPGPGATTAY